MSTKEELIYGEELQEMDDEGDIAMFVNEVAEGVSRCLAVGHPDSETRRLWLEALLEAELTDIALGGIAWPRAPGTPS